MKSIGLASAVMSLALAMSIVLIETLQGVANETLFQAYAGSDAFTAAGFSGCALAVLMLLLDHDRSAALFAGLVVISGTVVICDLTGISAALLGPNSAQLSLGSAMPRHIVLGAVVLQVVFGAGCLLLGLVRRRGSQDSRIASWLFLAIALSAEALVMLSAGLADSHRAFVVVGAGMLLLAAAVIVQGGRRDPVPLDHPQLWVPIVLALAIATADLVATRTDAVRWAYLLVVACGLLFPQRAFVRVFTAISIALIVFGSVASQRELASVGGLVDAGLAICVILIAGVLVDRQCKARHVHRETIERLAAIQRMTATACFELDLESMTFAPSAAFEALHGRTSCARDDWRSFVAMHIPPDQQRALSATLAAARDGHATDTLAYSFQRLDGEPGDAQLHWVPTRDDHGMIVSLTGIVQDVTAQRQCERGRAELRSRLCEAQKLEMLGLLAGGVAHDLGNTLVPVTLLAPLLLDSITDPTDRQSVELIIEAAHRARTLARTMLACTREDAAALERVRLDRLVRDSLPLLRARVPAGVTIVDALAPVPAIEGNLCQLYQVLLNLTVNAAQAIGTHGGTVTIGIAAEPPGASRPRLVRLFVEDDGEGIAPETLDRIFEPFFSTKAGDDASGIGLAIVRCIVQTHSGVISAKSTPGGGARFDLLFPVAAPALSLSLLPTPASEALWQSASTSSTTTNPSVARC